MANPATAQTPMDNQTPNNSTQNPTSQQQAPTAGDKNQAANDMQKSASKSGEGETTGHSCSSC